ncbi:MAG: PEP/pyruvate-binding domain-containing protein [Nanoarchaeota archaeon]
MGFIIWFKELGLEDYSEKIEVFRKANSYGIEIPQGFVIPNYVFQMFMKQSKLEEHLPFLYGSNESAEKKAEQMQIWVRNEKLEEEFKQELLENYTALGDNCVVAVRGPGESILNVKANRLIAAVSEAWASVFSEAWFEKASHGTVLPVVDLLIQTQLFGRKSVKASINDGQGSVLVNFGLPLSVVEGNSDVFDYTRGILKIKEFGKTSALFADPVTGEMEKQDLGDEEKATEVLTEFEKQALGESLVKLSHAIGPSSSTWTFEHGKWYLLAAKPFHEEKSYLPKHSELKLLASKNESENLLDEIKQKFPDSAELVERLREKLSGGKN